jgi:chloride channel 3/4/5
MGAEKAYVKANLVRVLQAPVALDIRSPMDLAYECFVKLGLRYICVLRDGKYAGMVSRLNPALLSPGSQVLIISVLQIHKKTFVKYTRELEEKQGGH